MCGIHPLQLVDSENEELKKVLSSGPSSSSRSPPPVSIAAGAPTGRPPPYSPSHRGHGVSDKYNVLHVANIMTHECTFVEV